MYQAKGTPAQLQRTPVVGRLDAAASGPAAPPASAAAGEGQGQGQRHHEHGGSGEQSARSRLRHGGLLRSDTPDEAGGGWCLKDAPERRWVARPADPTPGHLDVGAPAPVEEPRATPVRRGGWGGDAPHRHSHRRPRRRHRRRRGVGEVPRRARGLPAQRAAGPGGGRGGARLGCTIGDAVADHPRADRAGPGARPAPRTGRPARSRTDRPDGASPLSPRSRRAVASGSRSGTAATASACSSWHCRTPRPAPAPTSPRRRTSPPSRQRSASRSAPRKPSATTSRPYDAPRRCRWAPSSSGPCCPLPRSRPGSSSSR